MNESLDELEINRDEVRRQKDKLASVEDDIDDIRGDLYQVQRANSLTKPLDLNSNLTAKPDPDFGPDFDPGPHPLLVALFRGEEHAVQAAGPRQLGHE